MPDLAAPAALVDHHAYYRLLRREGPVHYLPRQGFWLVLDHAAVKQALDRADLFSSAPYEEIDAILLAAGPPRHREVRRRVAGLFTAERMRRLVDIASATAATSIARQFDVVADYGVPISYAVAAELIGFDTAAFTVAAQSARQTATLARGHLTLIRTLDGLADGARLFPSLIGLGASPVEARGLIRLLWLASTTTTERVITRAVLTLIEQPDVRSALITDRTLLPAFLDEVLRLHPPQLMLPRRTTVAASLAGISIRADADVRLCIAAANRDPTLFDAPDRLLLDRPPRLHFTFGAGIHRCLGTALTRNLVAAAITTLLDRIPDFELARPLVPTDRVATAIDLYQTRLPIRAGSAPSRSEPVGQSA
ncbi:cytochrome P450 [Sphingosinicella sp. BN140058]|uniref:cytochrome P450 n=1 Tax=Sphingosinicella sp. BN140058 TaxID=1892855 RepID=UPI0013ECE230|nr:cytochrome P450 [Sphingosinicella sp. BN140058]